MSKLKAIDTLNSLTKPGETVLWTGGPAKGIRFPPSNIIPFYTSSLVILILFALSTIRSIFLFWAIPFLFVLMINIIIFLLIRRTIIYRVTNQRIIIFSNFIAQSVRQIDMKSIKEVNLYMHHDGTGTITFDKKSWLSWPYWTPNPMYSLTPPKFECINTPTEVFEIINSIRKVPALVQDGVQDASIKKP